MMDLSFVFPCLNEEESLEFCIRELKDTLDQQELKYEIILADNGSTDHSISIAESHSLRIINVEKRGYGSALKAGFEAATGKYVMFADADGSYILNDSWSLYKSAVEADADMAIASRLTGDIEPGAMPGLHRHLGTPVLTRLINILFKGKLSDCNSGFRCVKKSAYMNWNIRSTGMEFASELLIKALKAKSSIIEIKSGLRKDRRSRDPHLRTWRDGMRHLLFILSEKPQLMERTGLCTLILSTLIQCIAVFVGPTTIQTFNIFDYHSHAILLLVACLATQVYLMSLYIFVNSDEKPLSISKRLLDMDEATLFVIMLFSIFTGVGAVITLFVLWGMSDFSKVGAINQFLTILHLLAITGFISIGLLGSHILKKTK